MSTEQQVNQRALTAALVGLGVQLGMALALVFLALWPETRHPALWAGMLFALGGLPLGCSLALLYHQQRLEQIEALEAELLARGAGQAPVESSLFERSIDDLSIARKRLKQLHRWLLPFTAFLTGGYLIAFAFFLFRDSVRSMGAEAEAPALPEEPILVMALCAGIAFAGFVTSRFLAGMARQRAWQFLQASAAYHMGAVLIGGLLAVAFALARYDSTLLLRYLTPFIPILMGLVGAEILINLILGIYRPRRPGEPQRPAFDSRILGLLALPGGIAKTLQEAVNYQFGFEVTRGWFWKLLEKAALPLFLFGIAVLLGASCVVVVEPHQQALVFRLGALQDKPLGPGLHAKWPWPLATVELHDVTRIHEIRVGSGGAAEADEEGHAHGAEEADEPILWTNDHGSHAGGLLIVASAPYAADDAPMPKSGAEGEQDDTGSAPSVSLIQADLPVQYRISDLAAFTRRARDAQGLITDLAEREVSRLLYARDIDTLLGPDRALIGPALKQRIQQAADAMGLGVEIVFVGMAAVHPPRNVAEEFHQSVEALLERETRIEEARESEIETLAVVAGRVDLANRIVSEIERLESLPPAADPAAQQQRAELEARIDPLMRTAGGEAARRIAEARAYRWQRENEERGNADRFNEELRAHQAAPRVYRMRKYLEALREGLADARKYLRIGDCKDLEIRLDLEYLGDDLSTFTPREKE